MNTSVRTTITLPASLLERLKTEAFYRKTTVSRLIRDGVAKVVKKKTSPAKSIFSLAGKYKLKGKKDEFKRSEFYDEYLRKKMSIGH